MRDFAYWLRHLRERSGMNQKELAERVGATGSYISLLESRKKPPPSDEVVRRLAAALRMEESVLLEFAHIERTPYDIKEQFEALRGRARMEDRLLAWIEGPLRSELVPRLLYDLVCPPTSHELTEDASAPPSELRRLLRRCQSLARGSPGQRDLLGEIERATRELKEPEFHSLLEWLPRTYRPAVRAGPIEPARASRLPVFIEIPWEAVEHRADPSGGWKEVPAPLFAPGRYYLIASGTSMFPRIEEGDFLLLDERMPPEPGDTVALLHKGLGQILRYVEAGSSVEFAPANPQFPPIRVARESLGTPGGPVIRGVVVEIERELK